MIKMRSFFVLLLALVCEFTFGQIVNIPDANFKNALLNNFPEIDTNNDGDIQVSEAQATIAITAVAQNISSIEGIEAFSNLERLYLFNNPIASVDLSANTQLQQINFTFNDLTSIDLSSNTLLSSVSLGNTNISTIDVSQLPNLELLDLSNTNISTIDLSSNPNLLSLALSFTNINSLDLSNNFALEGLGLRDTGISEFDFSIIPNLKSIIVNDTNFVHLDFSNNTQLCSMSARDCPLLTSINLQNGNNQALAANQDCSIVFTVGGSSATSGVFANTGNPNLDLICVDDIQFANDNFTLVPVQTQFVEDCSVLSVDSYSIQEVVLLYNPVKDNLVIESSITIQQFSIYSITGEKVLEGSVNDSKINVNVSTLSSGLYFMTLKSNDANTEILKFLKD